MNIDFCLPVYNEEKILEANILKLLEYLKNKKLSYSWKIIIINNGSNDKTEIISRRLARKHQSIHLFNVSLPGKGLALKTYWQKSQANIIAYMDIDLAVSLGHIPELITPILENKADLTMGSRLMAGSKIERSLIRELSSQSYNLLSRLLLNHKFSDMQCGFKAFRRSLWNEIDGQVLDKNFFFDTELICFSNLKNYRLKEFPVTWSENRYEERKSKVKMWRDSLKFLCNLLKLKIRIAKAIHELPGQS